MRYLSYKNKRPRSGLTLVEVMVGLALLAFGIGGAVELYSQQVRGVNTAKHRITTSYIARGELARFRAMGYDALNNTFFADAQSDTVVLKERQTEQNTWWKVQLTRQADAQPAPRIRIKVASSIGDTPGESGTTTGTQSSIQEVSGYAVKIQ